MKRTTDPPLRGRAPLGGDPWRLFFPLAILLAWAGTLSWLLYGAGVTDSYLAVFHATAQVQGFLTCMATGFLFTFVPRRTGTAPPATWELFAAGAGPVAAALAAWWDHWALAQVLWGAGAAVVAAFVLRRVVSGAGAGRVPGVFVWVAVAVVAGVASCALVAVAAAIGPHRVPDLWQLGRGGLLQGLLGGLVVGVGGTMLPTLTRGPAAPPGPGSRWAGRLPHAVVALVFFASFPLEVYGDVRAGLLLRAATGGGTLVGVARLWRLPSLPGLHRWILWTSAWLLPLGWGASALVPDQRAAVLHVVFIGAFGAMALAVSLHVALSHGGRPERLAESPWQTRALALLLLAALAFRILSGLDGARMRPWLGAAAASFFLATLAWAALALPAARAAGARPS
jgi:uncharacterized protein involved in response to NO